MRFVKIPESTFKELQMDAGILLKKFNPAEATAPADEDIVTATTGGINIVCQPSFSDFGADIDNCPNDTMELKHLDGWQCTASTTALGTSPELIRFSLGAADINAETGAIIPRRNVEIGDFGDLWWVGDKVGGGLVAVKLMHALSTAGFNLQTTKNGKGQISLTLTGHVSLYDQDTMPMEFYSLEADEEPETEPENP